MRRAADTRNAAEICTAYVKTARKILAEFPNMSAEEKQVHYDCLRHEIERLKVRTNQDCSNVLGELKWTFSSIRPVAGTVPPINKRQTSR